MIQGSGIVLPPISPLAPAPAPAAAASAERKAVELVLVRNPGDDVCFAKEDELRGSQQVPRAP